MRDLLLLTVTGLLLGLLGGTTLVVVREGGAHADRIARGEAGVDAPADSIAPTDLATHDLPEEGGAEVAASEPEGEAPASDDESAQDGAPSEIPAPTADDGRGTPQLEGAAAIPTDADAGPTIGGAAVPGPDDLARYLSAMQPREAARVLEQMTDREVAALLAMIGGRRASAIMASLSPERAAAVGRLALGSNPEDVS